MLTINPTLTFIRLLVYKRVLSSSFTPDHISCCSCLALLFSRACEDALRATETLPNYPKCWLKAGDALTALRKPKEAAGYYQVALDLDASMESYLKPKIEA